MLIAIRKVSREEAEGVLSFFDKNPERTDCTVGIAGPNPTDEAKQFSTWTRDDIPKLKGIVEEYDREAKGESGTKPA